MSWIIKIIFGKSLSRTYENVVKKAQSMPNFSDCEGIVTCGANNIREYITYHEEFKKLIHSVERWKSSHIYLYEKEYRRSLDYWKFLGRVKNEAGKYAPVLNNDSVAINSITIEDLPYPFVYYPPLYGAFFAFSKDIGQELCFCECEKEAIENYMALREHSPLKNYTGSKVYPLGSDYFPEQVAEKSRNCNGTPLEQFCFVPNICHRCNSRVPKLHYCHDMYAGGSEFKKNYGWFINQEYFKCGIDPYQDENILEQKCPPDIYDSIKRRNALQRRLKAEPDSQEIQDELAMYKREFHNTIENRARESLGFKKIGETWVSETILFNIVKGIYPSLKVIKHYRPKWLQGLELDIYIPELKLAFEYQGIQHFVPIEHWGGKTQLKKQKEHDNRKKEICEQMGVTLICINYDDELTSDFVKERIALAKY
ncbi:MAG: hypothetical protein LUE97_05345 [Oscillospiraceae bacterium]|nr:hypothetical protein [Oscillospiraceae bacterium]